MKNIVLTGFMGTGKSSLGKITAEKLGFEFLDTDDLIEQKTGLPISKIFDGYGEDYFRELERETARELAALSHRVIATGGGFPLNAANVEILRDNSFVILLLAKAETIFGRLVGNNSRPLLQTDDPLNVIRRLMDERKEYYDSTADFFLSTESGDLDKLSDTVIAEWRKRGFDIETD